ncbi:hypothetical protein ACTFIZ_010833 [Dictyostelium cf. discoideum]
MGKIENISYIISTHYSGIHHTIVESFILSLKDDKFYCKSLSYDTGNSSKAKVNSVPFIKIQQKTFELSCIYFNNPNNFTPSMTFYEIDYCEPDDSFSRYSCQESFCVVNVNRSPNIFYYDNILLPNIVIPYKSPRIYLLW